MRAIATSLAGVCLAAILTGSAAPPMPTPQGPLIGITVASKVAAIAAEQPGKIVAVPVTDGTRVAKDDVLFELSSKLERLEVERLRSLADSNLIKQRAVAALRHAEQQEGRVRNLRDKEISSDSDLQAQAFELELAQLRVEQADIEQAQAANELAQAVERLDQRTVRSPFDGTVTQRFHSEGETVEKFVPVLEVMSLDPIWVEFDCPITEQHMFRVGGEVRVAPSFQPDDPRVGRILFVSQKASTSSHTFMVRAAVANTDLSWKAGLKMLVDLPPAAEVPSKPGK